MNDRVRDAYDRIAEQYAASRDRFNSRPYLERFTALLPARAVVLDIGCGAGIPAARYLAERGFAVTGLDISSRMVELARKNVPEARFEVCDMLSLRPGEFTADGIVALYSVFHVERTEHERLMRVLRGNLKAGGVILLTMGAGDWEGMEPDFHGTTMYWSHFGPERNRALLETTGFTVLLDEIDTSGGERHQVFLATAT